MLSNNGLCTVTIFSIGSKFRPVSNFTEVHALIQATHSYVLLRAITQHFLNCVVVCIRGGYIWNKTFQSAVQHTLTALYCSSLQRHVGSLRTWQQLLPPPSSPPGTSVPCVDILSVHFTQSYVHNHPIPYNGVLFSARQIRNSQEWG